MSLHFHQSRLRQQRQQQLQMHLIPVLELFFPQFFVFLSMQMKPTVISQVQGAERLRGRQTTSSWRPFGDHFSEPNVFQTKDKVQSFFLMRDPPFCLPFFPIASKRAGGGNGALAKLLPLLPLRGTNEMAQIECGVEKPEECLALLCFRPF